MKTILLLGLIFTPFFAHAAGIGVSVEKIEIRAWDFFPTGATFSIQNPNSYHAAFRLTSEGTGSGWIKFSDSRVVLAPNESREITVKVSARRGGEFEPVMLIEETPLEGNSLNIGSGIRLPVKIQSRALTGPLLAATLTLLLVVMTKFLKQRRIRKT